MRKPVVAAFLLMFGFPSGGMASVAVFPGCNVPTLKPGHHTFYVDPVHGSMTGDGSAEKPWHTLSEVLNLPSKLVATQGHKVRGGTDPLSDVNPNGPIKAGDVILLESGNHGDVFVQGAFNKDFITIMPAPDARPVLSSLRFQSSQNWLVEGVTVTPGDNVLHAAAIASLGYGDWLGTSNNLILTGSTIATVTDASGWSSADWLSKPKQLGIWLGGGVSCLSVTNNHVLNVVNGIGAASPQALVQGNLIERMLNDGIDVTTSDVTIRGNTIRNGANIAGNPQHADGIQGWSVSKNGVVQVNENVIIDDNTLIRTGDGTVNYMQGISIFDGKWKNLEIANNSVAINTWNGITVAAPVDSKVINNTVYGTDPHFHTHFAVALAKDKTAPQNTMVRNNVAPEMYVFGTNMQFDHNVAQYLISNGTTTIRSGGLGDHNMVKSSLSAGFVSAGTSESTIDLRLKDSSPAVGAGTAADAPATDIAGKPRKPPVDAGAYAF